VLTEISNVTSYDNSRNWNVGLGAGLSELPAKRRANGSARGYVNRGEGPNAIFNRDGHFCAGRRSPMASYSAGADRAERVGGVGDRVGYAAGGVPAETVKHSVEK